MLESKCVKIGVWLRGLLAATIACVSVPEAPKGAVDNFLWWNVINDLKKGKL